MSYFQPLNTKQILLDWVNTINEPRCLLVSNFDDMQDGRVFLEILFNFLRARNALNTKINLMKILEGDPFKQTLRLISKILEELIYKEYKESFSELEIIFEDESE